MYFVFRAKPDPTFLDPQKSSQHFLDSQCFPMCCRVHFVILLGSQVGYGDLVPTNDLERAIACLTMVCGTTMFSYVIGSVSTLVM